MLRCAVGGNQGPIGSWGSQTTIVWNPTTCLARDYSSFEYISPLYLRLLRHMGNSARVKLKQKGSAGTENLFHLRKNTSQQDGI